ncbi:branched-chain amino acid ABC transporter permease [Haloplanus aerogenes]|uniref:Amino acid/amide ABC transporter membrane protein 2 (HAAT family) n=1 Tax=Haloplanus aerogenes TaxID=660522 RepID=A0A3M0DQ01_9EURY|nr:branched-chain amino acid ABC transporter permease [Haloplanus aerogenes]AZH24501.1 branched-chain amino acid ABC transporter permease [Haloplanus aerogenes]RMB23851.1 amino acid/amide ABC transporter membrane protein 2 (HAAT family) [Haloplanus aerogenes]
MAASDVVISFMLLVSIYGILSLGLNIKYGHTGLLDFGHVGFYLIGAYTAALFVLGPDDPTDFTTYVVGLGDVPVIGTWAVAILAATLLAGLIGGLVALPTIRLREDYLAITVLGVSVIFQRVVQSETWLANGPDALRGYSPPLQGLFPLAMDTLVGPAMFGLIVAVVWAIATGALGQLRDGSRWPLDRVYALTTFSLSRLRRRTDALGSQSSVAAGAGAVAGVVVAVALAAFDPLLAVGVLVSLYTWFVALIAVAHRYGDLGRREWGVGVGLGTGLLVALLPLPVLDAVSLKIAVTLGLLAVLVAAYYYGVTRVAWMADVKLTVVAVGSLWFVSLWYFLLPLLGPLGQGDVSGALNVLFQNVVWVLQFGGDVGIDYYVAGIGTLTTKVDYSRFQLAGFVLFLAGLYYVLELTVQSPFGRVLRAVRNDETVVQSLGKDPFVYKVQSMVIGSALGGFAGALWAMYAQGLTFTTFAPRVTFIALLIMFVGGAGNNKGMLLGAGIFWAFQQATTQLAAYFPPAIRVNIQAFRLVVVGVLFLLVLYYVPEGLLGGTTGSTGEEVDG